jgi:hypothetical protein
VSHLPYLLLCLPVLLAGLTLSSCQFNGPEGSVSAGDPEAMPRIVVHNGRFVESGSQRAFHPVGFNYIRLRPKWHGTFAPGRYDGSRASEMLAELAGHGFNTVRVFIDPATGAGIVKQFNAETLSEAYMANVLDFLSRARRERIYTVVSLLGLPAARAYNEIIGRERDRWWAGNRMYLDRRFHQAKARYVSDFVRAIGDHDPALLPAVLACELDNETTLFADGPFAAGNGQTTGPDGKTYDLSSNEQLQALADESVRMWADACVEAIRQVDPEMLVSVNVFTFRAVGRTGPGDILGANTRDRRFPARPLALVETRLDYLDIHFYPFSEKTLPADLESIEFAALAPAAERAGKPLIMGEFGAFKNNWKTIDQAENAMRSHLRAVLKLGFTGFLYWTYDTDEQNELWNARSDRGQIFEMLQEFVAQPQPEGGGR